MKQPFISDHAIIRMQNVIRKMQRFDRLPETQAMAMRLERALKSLDRKSEDRPVSIVFLGGTGVGKSELFNALLGEKNLSPTSETIRPKTVQAHVAVSAAEKRFLASLEDPETVFMNHHLPGMALIDAPDVDSVESTHVERTRRFVAAADVVVYVSSPDKRANFTIHEQVRQWSARKRWFFVLNKIDLVPDAERTAVSEDFMRRLRDLGFEVDQDCFFTLSAVYPYDAEFVRFKNSLFTTRAVEQVQALRAEAFFNQVRFALPEDLLQSIQQRRDQLKLREDELHARVRKVFLQLLSDARSQDTVHQIVREQAWRLTAGRVGGFLAFPVWVRSRLAFSGLAFQLARMASGGPSLGRMLQAGWFAAKAAWQGMLPMQVLLKGFSAEQAGQLRGIAQDAQRYVQDMGLDHLQEGAGFSSDEPVNQAHLPQPAWVVRALRILQSQGIGAQQPEDHQTKALIQERLENAVVTCAAEMVFSRLRWWHTLFGNLLPMLVFGHAAYRLSIGWLEGVWLPFEFYLTAIAVFLFSLLPGYGLVTAALSRRANMPDLHALVGAIERPVETAGLQMVRERLDDLLQEVHALRDSARTSLQVLRQELDPSHFGAAIRHSFPDSER
jgi:GTP-binding protein EngB required for normal cell division